MTTTKPAWVTSDYGTSYDDSIRRWLNDPDATLTTEEN